MCKMTFVEEGGGEKEVAVTGQAQLKWPINITLFPHFQEISRQHDRCESLRVQNSLNQEAVTSFN